VEEPTDGGGQRSVSVTAIVRRRHTSSLDIVGSASTASLSSPSVSSPSVSSPALQPTKR